MIRRSGRRRSPMSFARQPTTLWLLSMPDLRPIRVPGRDLRGASLVPTTTRAAAFAAARLHKSPLTSQTVWVNPRAVRAAVAMEHAPLP